jgi:two-component sensor histidine kinase
VERNQSQEKLRKSETLLKATQQLAKIGGWEWDVETQTMFWTEEVYRIHEITEETIKPDSTAYLNQGWQCFDANDRELIQTAFQVCINEARPYDLELPITTVKGNRIWIRTTAQPILIEGKVVKVLGSTMNISESKQSEERIKASLSEKEVLLQEIHHRVKNNMQVIASLIKLQMNQENDERVRLILTESYGRVYAMSAIHEALHQSESLTEIVLTSYLSKIAHALFQTYSVRSADVDFVIESAVIHLSIEKANPLGLVVNELISNSLKHAFPDNRHGKIVIKINQPTSNEINLVVADDGIGFPAGLDWKNTGSLGLQLVKTLIENQLDGSIRQENTTGTKFIIFFKIEPD